MQFFKMQKVKNDNKKKSHVTITCARDSSRALNRLAACQRARARSRASNGED